MADPAQLAKAAREQLAAALNALQTSPDTPDALLEAAEPIAQTMGILHRIERTNGQNLEGRDVALAGVRDALDRIQKVDSDHPAVEMVMDAVASSLTKVHALVRYTPPAPAPAPAAIAPMKTVVLADPPAAAVAPTAPVAVVPSRTVPIQPAPEPPPPVRTPTPQPMPAVVPADVARPARSTQMLSPNQPVASPTAAQHHPQVAPAAHLESAAFPLIQPAQRPIAASSTQPSVPSSQVPMDRPAPQVVVQPARQSAPAEQPRGGGPTVDAELGTHSASNFYKGLGGNDVIEHGGIFVATYKIMKIGSVVSLRVHLPGDYEFHATAVVQWIREGTSEPGFGARFTQISPEGRQLVYRYTRNREPMFYDDL